ncbi:protein translocase subunit SecD [Granulicella tundricola]|uniref:Protein translocase subunit SecD n=1 Tax=Granulicella tundricola (strain ATCC BAA-1859 / DSM 23138 / MP5ACTX9) TaxID=1198114 RepID=E8X5K0_GRATM|nr:protein translocase subunit SecD [Granulicella tundricola]ADW70627.1 protein-export membrane protein SecD [Granulicella tundricola MP5ACTX9]
MGKNLATKLAAIVVVLLFFIYGIIGIPHGSLKQSIADRIHLGLDLKGGIHLVLAVHVEEAVASTTDRDVQRLEAALPAGGVTGATVGKSDPAHQDIITITGVPVGQMSSLRTLVGGNDYASYEASSQPDGSMRLTMKPTAISDLEARTLETSIETIRQRVDSLGVSEPTIQKYGLGDNQVLVELPGIANADEVEQAIQSTSKLAVYAVVSGPYESEQAAMTTLNNVIPPDATLVHGQSTPNSPDQVWLLNRASEVEGTDFRDASGGTDVNGRPNIHFTLTTEAGDRFYKYTDAHKTGSPTPGSMAIVLGNKVREVASINGAIRDQGEITGTFTQAEVDNLSLMLRTGALPASISYLETRTVGPSLGAASIRQGVIAAVVGMAAVMIFMLIYYKGSGINADLALLLNLLILLGFMGYSHATLTLPGIAGVILTIGMGVDSNVLIFERIREELRAGKTAAAAVKEGFAHAWITIVDTHVTTIVSAAILFLFGTGPVKGFAVTLTFGLLANLFTAVYVSRLIFDAHLKGKERGTALSI